MRRRLYLSIILFVMAVFLSCRCDAANETTFMNTTRSRLKILGVFGHLGKSHFDVFKPLLEELARRGHELTVISHFPRSENAKVKKPLPNYKDISLVDAKLGVYVDVVDLNQIHHDIFSFLRELYVLRFMADAACGSGLQNPAIKELLQSDEKFDLIITENFNTDCFLGFVHRFKAPFLGMSSCQIMPWVNKDFGNEDNPSYIPSVFLHSTTSPINLSERIWNKVIVTISKLAYDHWYRPRDQIFANKIFGPDLPELSKIARQSQALLVNTHSSIHGSNPQLPNVVEIGGLHIPSKVNPLPSDIAKFLDSAHEGVIYFSLGSMIKSTTMPREKLDVILTVLGSLPQKVIWKWESDKLPRKLDNVMIKQWLPQFDVMNHPNVKCYLGHGGLLGVSEAVYVGLPMIMVPMYGDQFHNAAAVKARGSAVVLEFNNLNEESLRHAIDEVFNNTRYRENAQRLSKAYRDRPATPLETAVWWTEYIARGNGSPFLRSDGADIPLYQRHLIDVMLVLIIVSAVLIYIIFRLIKLLLSLLRAVKGVLGSGAKEKSKRKKID